MQPQTDSRWLMLAVLFLARVALGYQFQSVASTAPLLVEHLGIGYVQVGTLIGLYMLPGVVIALPGGLLGRRFGDKAICTAGLTLMILGGLLLGYADDYGISIAGRLLSGVGAVMFNLVLTKMATDWFAGREIVFAMAVVLASWPFGIAAGLLTQGPLARAEGWHAAMHAATALCALALVLVALVYRPPAQAGNGPEVTKRGGLPIGRDLAAIAVIGLGWGCFNLGLVVFFSFAPLMLAEQGFAALSASSWTGLALWISMFSIPLCGFAVQRSGRPDATVILFSAALAAVMVLFPLTALPVVLCVGFGLLVGPAPGAIMAMPARALSPENRVAGLGVFYTVYYAVVAIGPLFAGVLRDRFQSASAAVMLGAVAFLLVVPCTVGFRMLVRPKIPVGAADFYQ